MRKNMNLVTLTQKELKESNSIGGGAASGYCYCACRYEGIPGEVGTDTNCSANHRVGLQSPDQIPL